MELVRAMELVCSLSNEVLGKLHKEFRPGYFNGWSPAYWQHIYKKIILKFVLVSSLDLHLKLTILKL